MIDELLVNMIANFPNLAGLLALAYVLYKLHKDLEDRYTELLGKYHDLVETLFSNRVISRDQLTILKDKHDDTRQFE